MRTLRLLLPLALIVLGLSLLAGCIYIPTFGRTIDGENVAKKVGDEQSRKPVRVNRTTRDQVLSLLGPPDLMNSDGSALAYTWTVQNGFAVWPLCFTGSSVDGYRTLVLRFNPAGKLASFKVLKANEPLLDFGGTTHPMPDDLRDEQRRRLYPQTAPSTRSNP